ncbi:MULTISPECIES: hypothetical protein [Candidatus Williamhamiltonella]|uniref:Uncharacterized protein n=2 Tax=Candidatus Williamhamiltonella defendens TaxID=138072 RepID=A0A2D3TD10_9ENTR|nr:hypothetical protein [Candidatus Hamiltonella defensa]ATW33692.1 hypothetical protein BJP43_04730 [Candidatus Hamiltonella defensa]
MKYDDKQHQLEGVSLANQKKTLLHLLDDKVKQKMAGYQSLAQKSILLQMKCFDDYHRPLCWLHSDGWYRYYKHNRNRKRFTYDCCKFNSSNERTFSDPKFCIFKLIKYNLLQK